MSSFKLAFHGVTGRRIVEIWEDNALIGAIYPDESRPHAIRVISKHAIVADLDISQEPLSLNVQIVVRP